MSKLLPALLLCAAAAVVTAADLDSARRSTVTGTTADSSEKVWVEVRPSDAATGCERSYLVDVAAGAAGAPGSFSQAVRYFPGANMVDVWSATSHEIRQPVLKVARKSLRVRMEWTSDDLDYDLYVNNVNWTFTASDGGNLDRDTIHPNGFAAENITFPTAAPGLYSVYVNFYSDHGHGTSAATTIKIYLDEQQIYTATKTLSASEQHGGSLGGDGKSVWNVATVVMHGEKAGGYAVVDQDWADAKQGYRDLYPPAPAKSVVKDGSAFEINPRTSFAVSSLQGPNGTDRVVIAKGQSAQFRATGTANDGSSNSESRGIIGQFKTGDASIATIDDLGVLTGVGAGKTTVTVNGGGQSIDVYVIDVDLEVDADRDGSVAAASDHPLKQVWTRERGAIYMVNYDDDDGDGKPDAIGFDDTGKPVDESDHIRDDIDATDIASLDFAKIGVRPPAGAQLVLKAADADQPKAFHFYADLAGGEKVKWGGQGGSGAPNAQEFDVSALLKTDDATHGGVEGLLFRNTGTINPFKGFVELTLELRDNGKVIKSDQVKLKVAPWMMIPNSQNTRELWALDFVEPTDPKGEACSKQMRLQASAAAGYQALDATGKLQNVAMADDPGGQWLQDHIEIGFTRRPGSVDIFSVFRLPYGDNPGWPAKRLLSAGTGVFTLGKDIFMGAAPVVDGATVISGGFGGNVEVSHPTDKWPLGRIVLGDSRPDELKKFLDSQEVQLPIDVPTKWLSVAHVDEYLAFSAKDTVVIADPAGAYAKLNAVPAADQPKKLLFATTAKSELGAVTVNAVAGGTRLDTGVDLTGKSWEWLRIYDSAASGSGAAGQVAHISALDNGFLTVDKVYRTGTKVVPTAAGGGAFTQYDMVRGSLFSIENANWLIAPKVGDKFVLCEGTRFWEHGATGNETPAVITLQEVLADADFRNLNTVLAPGAINPVQAQLDGALGKAQTYVKVPVLFVGKVGAFAAGRSCVAYSPGGANMQFAAGKAWVPRQYSFDDGGADAFEKMIKAAVGNAQFVEDFDLYHRREGEVHCGTATKRDALTDWFKHIPKP